MENQFEMKRYLSPEEIADPYSVIHDLYNNITDIEYIKSDLWEWVKATIQKQSLTYLGEPGMAIHLEKTMNRILIALSLLAKQQLLHLPENIIAEEEKQQQAYQKMKHLYELFYSHQGHVRRLNPAEVANPFVAVQACFAFHSLEEWNSILSQWLEYALTETSIAEADEDFLFLQEFDHLEKMFEVAYLLNKEQEKLKERYQKPYWKGLEKALRAQPEREVSLKLIKASIRFINIVPPTRFNQNIRGMLLDYLHYNNGGLPTNFQNTLLDLEYFFDFLDACAKETKHWDREEERDED